MALFLFPPLCGIAMAAQPEAWLDYGLQKANPAMGIMQWANA